MTASTGGKFLGRRVHIAGSANASTDHERIRYAHQVTALVARDVVAEGGGLVLAVGREPRADDGDDSLPPLTFDWTALEVADTALRTGACRWPAAAGLPLVVVTSEKAESEIPEGRRPLWTSLVQSDFARVERIVPGSRAAALVRQRQASFGDALLTLGGGSGVEHLADMYLGNRRSVIALDLPLGASRADGTGGSEQLARESRARPNHFLRMRRGLEDRAGSKLAGLATRSGAEPAREVSRRVTDLLGLLELPAAFYVRLLNTSHPGFPRVESFFRDVVDPVVSGAGLRRIEMGTDDAKHAFINVEIFDSLHYARVAVVDLTGCRPNCFVECGYALGRPTSVILTAEAGTKIPFDTAAIPCHFWNASTSVTTRRAEFSAFWKQNIDRPPLVPSGLY